MKICHCQIGVSFPVRLIKWTSYVEIEFEIFLFRFVSYLRTALELITAYALRLPISYLRICLSVDFPRKRSG